MSDSSRRSDESARVYPFPDRRRRAFARSITFELEDPVGLDEAARERLMALIQRAYEHVAWGGTAQRIDQIAYLNPATQRLPGIRIVPTW